MKKLIILVLLSIVAVSLYGQKNIDFSQLPLDKVIFLESANYPNKFIRHRNYLAEISTISSKLDKKDSSFRIVSALNGRSGYVSFESVNYPGYYLRHYNYRLRISKAESRQLYKDDASFKPVAGLSGTGYSFESANYPNYYIRHKKSMVFIDKNDNSSLFRKDASFTINGNNKQVAALDRTTDWDINTSDATQNLDNSKLTVNEVISLESVNYPNRFIRHRNYLAEISTISSKLDKKDGSFRIVPALNGRSGYVSFESVNYPGYYLRHYNYRLRISKAESRQLYKDDASFKPVAGLSGTGYSFESANYPNYYIRHKKSMVFIDKNDNSSLFRKDASFQLKK